VDSCLEPPILPSIVASWAQQPCFVAIRVTGLELSALKASVEVQHFVTVTTFKATEVFVQQGSSRVPSCWTSEAFEGSPLPQPFVA
jgi:hypothetical protein